MPATRPASEATSPAASASDVGNERVVCGTLWRRRARREIANDDLHAFFHVRPGHFGACAVVQSESYSHRLEFRRRRILRPQHRAGIGPTSASTAAASAAPAATTTLNPGTVLVRT